MFVSASHLVAFFIILFFIFVLFCLVLGVYFTKQLQKQSQDRPRNGKKHQSGYKQNKSRNFFASSRSKALQREILLLLHGEEKTLLRLLQSSQRNHRGKSIEWHLEKVKYDLERDRGAI